MSNNERLQQIREQQAERHANSWWTPMRDDIDYLLSLVDDQAALDCRPDMIAINREHAATAMRNKCVEKIKTHFGGLISKQVELCELVADIESLTLDTEQSHGPTERKE